MLDVFKTFLYVQQGGGGVMPWGMYSRLLLRACGCNQHQLNNILQPTMGRFPNTEEEFSAMQETSQDFA